MGLTESVNNFDTKLSQITTDIFKEVEKITGNPLEAEQKKLSNLVPFLRSVSSTIAELEQSKKELETTVKKFQEKGDELCLSATGRTGKRFSKIIKPNDLNSLYVYMENGDYCNDWATLNPTLVWENAIYPNLQRGAWTTKINGDYVMGGKKDPLNSEVFIVEAIKHPTSIEGYLPYAEKKEIMAI